MRTPILIVALAAALAACAIDTVAPDANKLGKVGIGIDTSSQVTTTPIRVSGRVLAMSATTAAQGADTLHYTPIAGIPLRIMRNILVNGASAQVLAASTTSDANGTYSVSGLQGGYYVVYAEPAPTSIYAGSYSYIAGTTPNVTVDLFIWRKP